MVPEPEEPEPLLEYRCTTLFPTAIGNERFRVLADGRVQHQRNEQEPPPGQEWCTPEPETVGIVERAEERLRELLRQGGFFDLATCTTNPDALDGCREELRWHPPADHRRVVAEAVDIPELAELVRALRGLCQLWGR